MIDVSLGRFDVDRHATTDLEAPVKLEDEESLFFAQMRGLASDVDLTPFARGNDQVQRRTPVGRRRRNAVVGCCCC